MGKHGLVLHPIMMGIKESNLSPFEDWGSIPCMESKEESLQKWIKTASRCSCVFLSIIALVVFFGMGSGKKKTKIISQPVLNGAQPPPPQIVETPSEAIVVHPALNRAPTIEALPQRSAYATLRCSAEDQRKIREIISSIVQHARGEMSFFEFVAKTGTFRQYEKEIDPVHPFKFLSTIFSDPDLKAGMGQAFNSFYLREGFMMGVNKGMNRESPRGNLIPYAPEFSREMNIREDILIHLLQQKEWEKIVRLLIGEVVN